MSLVTSIHRTQASMAFAFSAAWPIVDWGSYPVIAAVSGGSDSVALLRLMLTAKQQDAVDDPAHPTQPLYVVHFNHGMRSDPDDAKRDAQFVESLAAKLQLPFVGGVATRDLTSEEDARTARYGFLQQVAAKVGARLIATGHTANDQAETILHHAIRGSGLAGLSGIPRTRPLNDSVSIIRPLLSLRREQLREYLADSNQPFVDDATNDEPRYTRNRIRSELLPLLEEKYNPQVVAALIRMGTLAKSAQAEMTHIARQWLDQVVSFTPDNSVLITVNALRAANVSRHMIRELAILIWQRQHWPQKDMSFDKWDLLAEYVSRRDGHQPIQLPGGIRAEYVNDKIQLTQTV